MRQTSSKRAFVSPMLLPRQRLELFVIEIGAVEPSVKISCLGPKVVRIDRWVECVACPQQPDQPIDRGRLVDPAKRQGRSEINTLLRNAQFRPFGLFPRLP